MTDEEDAMHLAALDAVAHLSGESGEKALAALFRSEAPIHPMLREAIADALLAGRLRIHKGGTGKSGKPKPAFSKMADHLRAVSIGQFYLGRIAPCGNEKAAVADTCSTYGLSPRTARKYRDAARKWNAELAAELSRRGTQPPG
jgi:hypothetical protein